MGRARKKITLKTLPPIGFIVTYDDVQDYEVVEHSTYTSKSTGTVFANALWRSHCATCGAEFDQYTVEGKWPEIRRCKLHAGTRQRVKRSEVRASRPAYDFDKATAGMTEAEMVEYALYSPDVPWDGPLEDDGTPLIDRRPMRNESEANHARRMRAWETRAARYMAERDGVDLEDDLLR